MDSGIHLGKANLSLPCCIVKNRGENAYFQWHQEKKQSLQREEVMICFVVPDNYWLALNIHSPISVLTNQTAASAWKSCTTFKKMKCSVLAFGMSWTCSNFHCGQWVGLGGAPGLQGNQFPQILFVIKYWQESTAWWGMVYLNSDLVGKSVPAPKGEHPWP